MPYMALDSQSLPLLELRVGRAQDELARAIREATPDAVLAGLEETFLAWTGLGPDVLDEPQAVVYRKLAGLAEALMARDRLAPQNG